MPIYEYECASCHHKFDALQKIGEVAIKKCPACAKDKAIRLVSAAGFQLKGTGWYATDFKNKKSPEVKPEANAASKDTPSTEKKSTESSTTSAASTTPKGEMD